MATVHLEYDLVILGAGIAGLTAATTAAEAGLSVALIEKTDAIGGSSAMSGGWFAFCGTEEQRAAGVEDSTAAFFRDLQEVGAHRNDPELLNAYLRAQKGTYRWLKEHGVEFGEVEISSGQSAPRGHSTKIKTVLQTLHEHFERAGGATYYRSRGVELLKDQVGRVTSVVAERETGRVVFDGRLGIVLATGGFSRGAELLKIFAPDQLAAIPYGGRENTGDGLRLAWKLGAGMADMSAISGTYGSHPETSDDFQELLTAYYMGAIIVNARGERFVDESLDYKTLGKRVIVQPQGLGYQIFDATVRAKSHRGVALKDMDTLEDLGHIHSAETLGELAQLAGIDESALRATIEDYNAAARGERSDSFGRTSLCNGVGEVRPIEQAPFYAYPAKSLMTTTYGGLTITPEAEVTDVDGAVIEGLYAIGEVIGGFHGAGYMTGSSLGKGAVFGGIVARAAAQRHLLLEMSEV